MANVSVTQEETRTKVEIDDLRTRAVNSLSKILGKKWVKSDPMILDTYAWQYIAELTSGTNYMARPLCIVFPSTTEEVVEVVKACNKLGCQYKAHSTGMGAWGAPVKPDFVVQIDMRRLDAIIEVNEDNMYAVVEPYVTGNQLQTELFKQGFNTHIVGAGSQTSVLASATSVFGHGWDGISMGFSDRNLLGVEWVTPEGKVVHLGSFDADGTYASGDGPGFSLRGIMRGFGGTFGGMGVFTKCALKIYPWYGPRKWQYHGCSPDYFVDIPENTAAGVVVLKNWDGIAEFGYRVGEAEILDHMGRNAPSLLSGTLTTDNNEFQWIYQIPALKHMHYALMFNLQGQDKEDYEYKLKTLKAIVKEVGGGILCNDKGLSRLYWGARALRAISGESGVLGLIKSAPGVRKLIGTFVDRFGPSVGKTNAINYMTNMAYQAAVRCDMNIRGVFRFGGTFHTAMGSLVTWDNAIRGAHVGAQIKRKYIDAGIIFDDGGDNAWGGIYEGGAYAHLEELACYDPRDENCTEHANDYCIESNMACLEYNLGDCINGIGPMNHLVYSPACYDYDNWQQKIKAALDPGNVSDASFYTDPEFEENPPERVLKTFERIKANRAPVDISKI